MDRYQGFREFYAARAAALPRAAFFLTGSVEAGEELLQDALVKTVARWSNVVQGECGDSMCATVVWAHEKPTAILRGWRAKDAVRYEIPAGWTYAGALPHMGVAVIEPGSNVLYAIDKAGQRREVAQLPLDANLLLPGTVVR